MANSSLVLYFFNINLRAKLTGVCLEERDDLARVISPYVQTFNPEMMVDIHGACQYDISCCSLGITPSCEVNDSHVLGILWCIGERIINIDHFMTEYDVFCRTRSI